MTRATAPVCCVRGVLPSPAQGCDRLACGHAAHGFTGFGLSQQTVPAASRMARFAAALSRLSPVTDSSSVVGQAQTAQHYGTDHHLE